MFVNALHCWLRHPETSRYYDRIRVKKLRHSLYINTKYTTRSPKKVKEYDEAFRCYTCSLALDDTNARVYNNRAAAAHKLERFDQAEDDCTR